MSCDYGVWYSEAAVTNAEAAKIYLGLCEKWPYLEGESPAVRAFYDELTTRWPELDAVPDDKIDDKDLCPWSCEISHSGMAVVTACVWSMADKVGHFVEELAIKHRLVFFDPQSERVRVPEHLMAMQGRKSSWWSRFFGGSAE